MKMKGARMLIIETKLDSIKMDYPLEDICKPEEVLFVDIETTGFSPQSSILYMIGCTYFDSGSWITKQFFAENANDEGTITGAFASLASSYKMLIHFNGNHFDIPYLCDKCKQYHITQNFSAMDGIDLYKRLSAVTGLIKVPDCRQRTLEEFVGIERKNPSLGKDMISVYEQYTLRPDADMRARLLEHNLDDMTGMLHIIDLLRYSDLITKPQCVIKARTQHCTDYSGKDGIELIMKLKFPSVLPNEVSVSSKGCYFKCSGTEGYLKVPVYNEEMKYFYANYKDYYFVPEKDTAMHKSVSSFIDPSKRKQATASDCYTKKASLFLPVWYPAIGPFFKRNYNSKDSFIELTDKRKTDRKFFADYSMQVIEMISCG